METALHQIDAFADALFAGNPAAVMPLGAWPADDLLQRLADENNCAETAFYVPELPPEATPAPAGLPAYHLRWFTPVVEVNLCGHATLGAAAQILEDVDPDAAGVAFWSRSGWLIARRAGPGAVQIDLPATMPVPGERDPGARAALGAPVRESLVGLDQIYVLADAATVRDLDPDLRALGACDVRGVIVTAESDTAGVDFVSRFFGAAVGGGEDPVTGSAHAQLAPLWAARLGRNRLVARQLSRRGGTLTCHVTGERVELVGHYHRYLSGTVRLPDGASR